MPLPHLNAEGAKFQDARGINPPLIRAACHIGFALALAGKATDEDWDENKESVTNEVLECIRHLEANSDFKPTPFISEDAAEAIVILKEQFEQFNEDLADLSRLDTFAELSTLSNNLAFTSAKLERYVTGNDADEGRNP